MSSMQLMFGRSSNSNLENMKYIFILVCLICISDLIGQCPPGNLQLQTQQQINSFQTDYPGCTEINGTLDIDGFATSNISDLSPLNVLTSVTGSLIIEDNDLLISTFGLHNLTNIGSIIISQNDNLVLINLTNNASSFSSHVRINDNVGLQGLIIDGSFTTIEGQHIIDNNPNLPSVDGFNNFTTALDDVSIANLPALTNLNWLDNLTTSGPFSVVNCDQLVNLSGLTSLATTSFFAINSNDAMTSLEGLNSLSSVTWNLGIVNNSILTNLTALSGVSGQVQGDLEISNNSSLTNLTGLNNISSIGMNLEVTSNSNLLNIDALSSMIALGDNLHIHNNTNLTSVAGLINLSTVDGFINLQNNTSLNSLFGLDNINPGTITNITLAGNGILNFCSVQSICDWIDANPGQATISGNTTGCNSEAEVNAACLPCGSHPDYDALMAFYNSTNGASWTVNTGWVDGVAGTNCNPCNGWYGVSCNGNGRVNCIDMDSDPNCSFMGMFGNNLTGVLTEDIQFLDELETLLLDFNMIGGELPTSIVNMTNLVNLEIIENNFSGPIPPGLGLLPNLSVFSAQKNNLSGCFPSDLISKCGSFFNFSSNPLLPWEGDFTQFCATTGNSNEQFGAPCDVDNSIITSDVILDDCSCAELCQAYQAMWAPNSTDFCSGDELVLTVSFTGGNGPYDISGTTGNLSGIIDGETISVPSPSSGNYTITSVTDANGCQPDNLPYSVNITVHTNPGGSALVPPPTCVGDDMLIDFTFVSVGSSTNVISYNWTGPGYSSSTEDVLISDIQVSEEGAYNLVYTDNNNCSNSLSIDVVVNSIPTAQIFGGNTICPGGSTTLTASGGDTYLWSSGESTDVIQASNQDTYQVTVTDTNGCTASSNIDVEFQGLSVSGEGTEICNMNELDINVFTSDGSSSDIIVEFVDNPNVEGETDFSFFGGFGIIDNTLINTSTITQVVTYEVYTCPGFVNSIEVIVYPDLQVEFNDPLIVCDGFDIDVIAIPFGGSGNYVNYQWGAPGLETTSTISVNPFTTTTYVVTVTDDIGCTGSSQVQVFWNPPVQFDLIPTADVACQNGIEEELISIAVEFISGTSPYAITWNVDPGFNNLDYYLSNNNEVLTIYEETSTSGIYTISLEVEDANGCVQFEEIEIEVGQVPFILVQDIDLSCAGSNQPVFINVSGVATSGPPVSLIELYSCDNIFIEDAGGNSANFEVDPNIYNCLLVIVTDQNGCQASEEIVLNVNSIEVEPTLTGFSHCAGETSTVSVDNPNLYSNWTWNTGENISSITANRDTNFIYVVTVTEANTGCTGIESFEVLIEDRPNISLTGSLSFCSGSVTTLTAAGGASYVWTSQLSTLSSTADVTIDTPGNYNVLVTNTAGCTSDSTVTVIEDTELLVTLNTLLLCDSDTDTLSAGQSFTTYNWENSLGDNLGDDYLVVVGEGTYCVTVVDAAGCSGSTCSTVVSNTSPTVEVTPFVEVCREDVGLAPGVLLNFNDQVLGGVSGSWFNLDNIGGPNFLDDLNSVDFTGIARDTFKFEFRTDSAMGLCVEARDTMCVSVINCACPSVDVFPSPSICNVGGEVIDLETLESTTEEVTWTPTGSNIIDITSGSIVDVSGVAPGVYQFTMTLVNPVGGNCPDSNITSLIIVEGAIAEGIDNTVCNADSGNGPATIDLNSTLTSATTMGGIWTDATGAVVNNIFDGTGLTPGTFVVFTYMVTGTPPCFDVFTEVSITVVDCNCPPIELSTATLCNDNENLLDLNDLIILIAANQTGTWNSPSGSNQLPGGSLTGSELNPLGVAPGDYDLLFIFDNPEEGCPTDWPTTITILDPLQAIASEPDGFHVCNSLSGGISTSISLFNLLEPGYATGGLWSQTAGNSLTLQSDDTVNFEGETAGNEYIFAYNIEGNNTCNSISTEVLIIVDDCGCPFAGVNYPDDMCNKGGEVLDLNSLLDPGFNDGVWTINFSSTLIDLEQGVTLDPADKTPGIYNVCYTFDPAPMSSDCAMDTCVTLLIVEQKEGRLLLDNDLVCNNISNDNNNIYNFDAIVDNATPFDANGIWVQVDGDASIDMSNTQAVVFDEGAGVSVGDTYAFEYQLESETPCEYRSYPFTLIIDCSGCEPLPILSIPSLCSSVGIINFTDYETTRSGGTWTSTELTIVNNILDISSIAEGSYVVSYEVPDPEEEPCVNVVDVNLEIITAARPIVIGTEYCENTDSVTLQITNASSFSSIVWQEGSSEQMIKIATSDYQQIDLMTTDLNGCEEMITIPLQSTGSPGEECTDNNGFPGFLDDNCECITDTECNLLCADDFSFVQVGESTLVNVLDNDILPDGVSWQVKNISDDIIQVVNESEDGVLEIEVTENFFDTLYITYEVCKEDCSECSSAKLALMNEALMDVIQTNIISPNGDGSNEVLRFTENDVIEGSEIWIYNRWGDTVFHMENYDNSWNADGYPGGIYFYVLRVNGVDIKKTLTVVK